MKSDRFAELPAGLAFHCERCRVVIPADAPRPDGSDITGDTELSCEFVARHRLAWFNPKATPRHQHIMASAAWELVYHQHLRGEQPHAESVAYLRQFKLQPEEHWKTSAAAEAGAN